MNDCDELIEQLHTQARTHVHLALLAEAAPVAAMHLDLAEFSKHQARTAEDYCEDD